LFSFSVFTVASDDERREVVDRIEEYSIDPLWSYPWTSSWGHRDCDHLVWTFGIDLDTIIGTFA
jgi:hypothetical protein